MKKLSMISLLLVLAISLLAIGCKKAAEPVATDETMMENTVDATATEEVPADTTTETVEAEVEVATAPATV